MPLLDIATAQTTLQHSISTPRAYFVTNLNASCQFFTGDGRKLESRFESFDLRRSFVIKAVATLDTKPFVINDAGWNGRSIAAFHGDTDAGSVNVELTENAEDLDERERIRRMRISKANKGNTPWNKGRKHSQETLQRIRERTKLAMQDPKVKMKLANLGHAQSDETRVKIALGVRLGWQKRREKLMLQEMCYFEWQNLVSEASRKGYTGEKELQWHSYDVLREKLEVEWVESVEQRKTTKSISSRRAPKSAEQRRKIAEAIAAKWADPGYRERVCEGISKYHGTAEGAPRKPRRKSTGFTKHPKLQANNDISSSSKPGNSSVALRLRKSKTPVYKDPMARSKLEMLKNIRAQRAAEETKKFEAIERARLLIAEAEKAATALEVAATRSPVARASLLETRMLIAEAIRSIESVNTGMISFDENSENEPAQPNGLTSFTDGHGETPNKDSSEVEEKYVNGLGIVNGNDSILLSPLPERINGFTSCALELELHQNRPKQVNGIHLNGLKPVKNAVQLETEDHLPEENESIPASAKKKWVRGRLIEVSKND